VEYRSGFCCFVGRPNVGKSTLVNRLVGAPVAITNPKPQTTRRALRGILTRADGQLVLVDTPGWHRPRTLLGERLNDLTRATLADMDVIAFCVPADERVGPGDRFIAAELAGMKAPVIAVVTKTDAATRELIAAQLAAVGELGGWQEVVPVSAQSGDQVGLLADLLVGQLPAGPPLYPPEMTTDQPVEARVAELIRSAALADVRDELPHSIAVTVEEMHERPGRDLVDIYATIHLERPSQKRILIGTGGQRLKQIGTSARQLIEELLGKHVHLDIHVGVEHEWQRDPKKLDRLGF
jgi:GTP-binding protein Era